MHLVYASSQYQVVEYPGDRGGFEVIDRSRGRGIYLQGALAERFRESLGSVFADEPSEESVDEFLDNYDLLMSQPAVLH